MIITKDAQEIVWMKEAGRVVALVHQKLAMVIVPGITTKQINEICEEVIYANGATPSFLNLYGFPASVCTSINEVVFHGIPDNTVLKNCDIISVDVGACVHGYHGDSAWTYAVGTIDEKAKQLMDVCEQSLYVGLEQVKPGNRVSDISYAIQTYLESNGCQTPRDYTGHGIGSTVHEDPAVPNFGNPGRGPRLKKGMALAIEPMVNLGKRDVYMEKDGWTVRTSDGLVSAHYEHTVLITEDEPELLTWGDEE